MSGRTILMIGCRPQLLRAARAGGFPVVIVYGPWEKDWILPHPSYAEEVVLVDDPARVDLVLTGLARHGMRDRRFAAICPASDEYVLPSAILSTVLATTAPAPGPLDALVWKDKSLQKATVRAAGLPTAAYQVIPDVLDDLPALPDVRFPAVLKPVAGAGTAYTYILDDAESLRTTVAALPANLSCRTFLLEQFVRGNESHVDGILHEGELLFISIGRYRQNLVNASMGSLIVSTIVDPVDETDFYQRVHRFGVDLATAQLEILTGTKPTIEVDLDRQAVSMLLLPTIPGSLRSCPSAAELMAQPNVEYAEIQKPAGAVLRSKMSCRPPGSARPVGARRPPQPPRATHGSRLIKNPSVTAADTTTCPGARSSVDASSL